MKEYIIKDKVLKHLTENKTVTSLTLHDNFKYDYDFILVILDELSSLGYVLNLPIASNSQKHPQYLVRITHLGRFFLNQSGGFSKLHHAEIWKQRETKAKTALSASSTLIIIIISIWGVYVADKSNKVEKLESEIQFLKHENDSLMNQSRYLFGKLTGQKPRP